ncbi:hypothetical protein IM793_16875 [Pedobacter sp. MR2016-19]|uniref:hypothetical protein n=1 Tax=Pedobacter sp. MR2016-19 TaxID=2780089 RepID=UPI0018770B98|nr:hypothetical protein [Pedobacter sp. MR2016-19]MBE5320845.1 hypothetical protein [Pedobacter sp. MR2016-19]
MLKPPLYRKLRGYAFDPSLSLKIDTAEINEITYKVPWEELGPGPCGEYLEILDIDPSTGSTYQPVDLDNPYLLAQDGLPPSEANPMFHQQMVYAVVMTTIANFEKALGRKVLWAPQRVEDKVYEKYVAKLRVMPHALRDANAYYSPMKKALLFGYFSSTPADETLHMPDSLVFTALSHDIIAHETTHAILDGMHSSYNKPTNPDVLAFHEAFADIVALFQHFTFPEVLKHQIRKTRGDLASQNLLGQLAQEFGSAIGNYGSLRDAIGHFNPLTKKWEPTQPDPQDYRTQFEPHKRGSILVAAVFEAFLNIYKSRIADLLRIASNGSGILPEGELHPDLVERLAQEASKSAGHTLNMCIRALDYCPPMDITFGDFLRAIITADSDLVQEDDRNYRLAFIDAFRKRGIYPEGIRTLSEDSLRYTDLDIGYIDKDEQIASTRLSAVIDPETQRLLGIIYKFLRGYGDVIKYITDRKEIYEKTRDYIAGKYVKEGEVIMGLHARIGVKFNNSNAFSQITGLAFVGHYADLGIRKSRRSTGPSFQIQNLRLVSRVGPGNRQVNQVVFSIAMHSTVKLDGDTPVFYEFPVPKKNEPYTHHEIPEGFVELSGGCTLIFDLDHLKLRYAVSKPLLETGAEGNPSINMTRLKRLVNFYQQNFANEFESYFSSPGQMNLEPFAFLHQH